MGPSTKVNSGLICSIGKYVLRREKNIVFIMWFHSEGVRIKELTWLQNIWESPN